MPTLLFRLNNVPEDEAEEVRELLAEYHIRFYETSAGRWGISLAAIWIRDEDEDQLVRAREAIERYQQAREERARADYEASRRAGEHETLASRLIDSPLRSVLYLAGILSVLFFTLMPFVNWR